VPVPGLYLADAASITVQAWYWRLNGMFTEKLDTDNAWDTLCLMMSNAFRKSRKSWNNKNIAKTKNDFICDCSRNKIKSLFVSIPLEVFDYRNGSVFVRTRLADCSHVTAIGQSRSHKNARRVLIDRTPTTLRMLQSVPHKNAIMGQYRASTGPVLALNGMFTGLFSVDGSLCT